MSWHARSAFQGMLVLCALAGMAGCGSRTPLQRPAGVEPVPAARGEEQPPASAELMEPGVQALPDRSAEPLKRSDERTVDPFDLPPS